MCRPEVSPFEAVFEIFTFFLRNVSPLNVIFAYFFHEMCRYHLENSVLIEGKRRRRFFFTKCVAPQNFYFFFAKCVATKS